MTTVNQTKNGGHATNCAIAVKFCKIIGAALVSLSCVVSVASQANTFRQDPGVSEHKIVIGTVVPAKGPLAEMGQAVRAVTIAFFDELNSQGGIYDRRFELKFIETAETPTATRVNLERVLTEYPVFAMTGAFIAGAEKEIIPLMSQKKVPLIGPLTLYPQTGSPLNRQVFYLLSGIDVQARALIDFAAKKPDLKNSGLAVVYPRSEVNASIFEAIKDQSKKDGWSAPRAYDYLAGNFDAAGIIKQLNQTTPQVVFLLGGSEEALSFMKEAEKVSWLPTIFLPTGSVGTAIFGVPAGFDGKVFISFPTSPADQTADGVKDFRALAEKYSLPSKHLAAQVSTYSSAKILVEGLRRAGKDLSREKLIQVLEGLHEYSTGLTPAISYGPNRRIGAMGAYVVSIDLKQKQFVPASGWINVN
ncbi:MAG: ABC transporter substrate-binding protein [Acidobacteriota bacterium]|nr:ABC transporter substrate-binding protein [Acidobacteriota bacterium]